MRSGVGGWKWDSGWLLEEAAKGGFELEGEPPKTIRLGP